MNDPSNRTLRRELLQYGTREFCKEMTRRSAPLRLAEGVPAIGRFFPQRCSQRDLEGGDLAVSFEGVGYAWNNLSKKVTFYGGANVTYNPDFRCADDGDLYVYFAKRTMAPPLFRLEKMETEVPNFVASWVNPHVARFGQEMFAGKLAQGFTVVRGKDESVEVEMGLLPLGAKPMRPFRKGEGRLLYENQRIELHQNQRDFVGPIFIDEDERVLEVKARVDGVDAVDLMLFPREVGEAALRAYWENPTAPPFSGTPIANEVLARSAPLQRRIPVRKGAYFVVFDHSTTLGKVSPPANLFDDRGAVVDYVIEIAEGS